MHLFMYVINILYKEWIFKYTCQRIATTLNCLSGLKANRVERLLKSCVIRKKDLASHQSRDRKLSREGVHHTDSSTPQQQVHIHRGLETYLLWGIHLWGRNAVEFCRQGDVYFLSCRETHHQRESGLWLSQAGTGQAWIQPPALFVSRLIKPSSDSCTHLPHEENVLMGWTFWVFLSPDPFSSWGKSI